LLLFPHVDTLLAMAELPKAFESKQIEEKTARFWQQRALFRANPLSRKPPFSLVMPPPNVTGVLHMGHALVTTLQDIIVRWKRMRGFEVLWVPGTDHAGISTQTVVERHLLATQGKKRRDFSREDFLSHVWAWKESSEARIVEQLKRLGSSCDWSRQRFTMDAGNNHAVRVMFKKLYDAGLIVKGDYLVNWDPVTQTAISDDEVEYEERQSFLWHLRYPLKDGSGHIVVATTRPETMLGDTAVAVSPKDPRYAHLIGARIAHPLTGREIPIISDPFVDPAFGTGMVKITPAHDPNDYQMAFRQGLPFLNMMTPDGRINDQGGAFAGLTMEEGRQAVVKALKELGLLEKTEPHLLRVGISYRSKAVIEPYMSKQWFIRMEGFKGRLRAAAEEGAVRLIPMHWETVYYHWIDNLRDWCISRQLWWGHRIPIWSAVDDPEQRICYDGEGEPEEVRRNPGKWVQEEDVLDTWFSSALWPFSTMGWPEATPEMQAFYPNSLLVTGHDILFFWVARMLMMGEYATGQFPFPTVFLHGLIYGKSYWREAPGGGVTYCSTEERQEYDLGKVPPKDVQSKWEKMSKSKGNVIDPLEIIDTFGTDAMRMALCASATQARQIDLDRRRFEEFRNFTNKIWNGARFVLMNLEGDDPLTAEAFGAGVDESLLGLEDRWLLSILERTVGEVNQQLESYSFDQAALRAYDFFWKEFCAYYVEISKPILFGRQGTPAQRRNKQKLLAIALCQAIRLLHPMAPFITEELFQIVKARLGGAPGKADADPYTVECARALQADACATALYPQPIRPEDLNPSIEATFQLVENVVYTIRNIRGEMKISPGTSTDVFLVGAPGDPRLSALSENFGMIRSLVRVDNLSVVAEDPHVPFAATGVVDALKIIIPVPPEQLSQEKSRLAKEQERLTNMRIKLQQQLDNPDFVAKAPPALIAKQHELQQQTARELDVVNRKLAQLETTNQ
jgi:valyl-tRNA synthetase